MDGYLVLLALGICWKVSLLLKSSGTFESSVSSCEQNTSGDMYYPSGNCLFASIFLFVIVLYVVKLRLSPTE